MRVGLFGGTFDPPHWGHVLPVEEARRTLELDRVLLLPTARPPHKPDRQFAPAHQRFAMLELATLDHPRLQISPFELGTDRPAFTIDTVEHFRRELPDVELVLLLGLDSFVSFHTWRRYQDIADLVRLGVMIRPGWQGRVKEADSEVRSWLRTGQAELVEGPMIEASSSAIRAHLGRGEAPPAGWVPDLVLHYLDKYPLYR